MAGGRRSWKQRFLLTTGCVFVAVCLGGVSLAGYTLVKYNSLQRYDDLDVDPVPAGDPENYLVVGSDIRAGSRAAESAEVGGQPSRRRSCRSTATRGFTSPAPTDPTRSTPPTRWAPTPRRAPST